jgi:hypothetical protein
LMRKTLGVRKPEEDEKIVTFERARKVGSDHAEYTH